jgi:transposase
MKFVKSLIEAEVRTLEELYKHYPDHRPRVRAHAILLSHRGFEINKITQIHLVDRDTVSSWIKQWECKGLIGLFDEIKSGRPCKLSPEEQSEVIAYTHEEPRSIKHTIAKVEKRYKKTVSRDTVKRILKKGKMIWKRMRTSLKSKRDPKKFADAKQAILALNGKQLLNEIDLYYYDESGFTLMPKIPYAWQKINENIELPTARSKSLNVLGLFQPNGGFESLVFEESINTLVVLNYFKQIAESITKETWIIMDNAPTHKSTAFMAMISIWKEKGLNIYFLPPYCPELNLIEILWRFIKYQWLPFRAYLSFGNLKNELNEILAHIGDKYQITFA